MKTTFLTLALCLCAPSATPSDAGIGVYLCHIFGPLHWRVCTPFPGNHR